MRIIFISISLLLTSLCHAQDLEQRLYDAYMCSDLTVWARYIDSVNWDTATNDERAMVLNYEYGYAAHAISLKQADAAQRLEQFTNHLEAYRAYLDSGVYYTYKTSICSFRLSLEKKQIAKQIKGIYDYIDRAMQISPNDPFVLTMQGNVEFFNPFFGSKQKALKYYLKADSIYNIHPNQYKYPRWNIRALQIPLLQSMEKLGYIEEAIQKCHEILARDPYFPFITELYLPTILKKKKR